ncbi:MAG: flagellar protein FlaG [candidate division Zixibacteria bacterium]|nr:flagellar protein FlaG [candidate division Zixibacteria bacterium]
MKVDPTTQTTGQQPLPDKAIKAEPEACPKVVINLPKSNQDREDSQDSNSDDMEVIKSLDSIRDVLAAKHIDLSWSIDNETNSIVIKFVERDSNKLIRQIPPEEILRLREHINEMLGMIYDSKV